MAPLLRGRFASKGSGENPEGDLLRPGMHRSSPCGNGLSIDGAPVRRQVGSARALCKQKKWPRFCGAVSRQREAERIRRATSLPRVCAEAVPAAVPVLPSTARPSAARSGANAPLASGKTAPLLRDHIAPKGSGEDPEGELSLPRVCAEAAPAAVPVLPSTARPSATRSGAPVPLASRKTAPLLRGRIASKGSGEDPKGALSLPRVCAEAAPAAVPVLCRRRAPAARSEAPVPLASRKNGPAFAGPFCVKGKRRGSGGRPLSPPGMRRSSPCGNAGHAIDGAPVRRQVRSKRAPCKRKNGPAFAGPFCVKGKRRGSGGRSPSPGRWTRPAPASRPGRRRSRPGGHPRRQSR